MDNQQRSKAIQLLDDYLTIIACANQDLTRYSGAYLMLDDFQASAGPVCYLRAKPSDLNNRWSISMLGSPRCPGDKIALYKSDALHWSQWGDFHKRFKDIDTDAFDGIVKYEFAGLNENADVVRHSWVYLANQFDRLRIMDPHERFIGENLLSYRKDQMIQRVVQMMIGTAFMEPSFWVAKVAIAPNTPSLSLITDPTGIKELWKFRDISEGKKRRDALLHWVSDHWRVTRKDPDVESYVRTQLRGSRSLQCSGLSVEVLESREDKVAIVKAEEDRVKLRKQKRDRRKRLAS